MDLFMRPVRFTAKRIFKFSKRPYFSIDWIQSFVILGIFISECLVGVKNLANNSLKGNWICSRRWKIENWTLEELNHFLAANILIQLLGIRARGKVQCECLYVIVGKVSKFLKNKDIVFLENGFRRGRDLWC